MPQTADATYAVEVDLRIIELGALRKEAAQTPAVRHPGKSHWPEKMRRLWSRLILFLDDAFERPPGEYPKPLLLRTRLILDDELRLTMERYGPPPKLIREAYIRMLKRITKHVRSPATPTVEDLGKHIVFHWPLSPRVITSPFGNRVDPILHHSSIRFHAGVDLAGKRGDVVGAAAPGRVIFAGWMGGRGNCIIIRHGGGYISLYAHLADVVVTPRAQVWAGTPIGFVGQTGRATGAHLHFEIRRNGVLLDPQVVIEGPVPDVP